jgi:hypothetical protein
VRGKFLHAKAVHRGLVRQLDDLVAPHHIEADAGDTGIQLVVHEEIAAIIGAVREGQVRVVQVAGIEGLPADAREVLPRFRREAFGQDLQALVGLAPAGGAVAVEHRDPDQLAHRGQPVDADLAALPGGEEDVVFIELARADLGALAAGLGGLRPRPGLRLGRRGAEGRQGGAARQAGGTRGRGGAQQLAAVDALVVVVGRHVALLAHRPGVAGASPLAPVRVMVVFGPLAAGSGTADMAICFSRFSRRWMLCGQRSSARYSSWHCMQ